MYPMAWSCRVASITLTGFDLRHIHIVQTLFPLKSNPWGLFPDVMLSSVIMCKLPLLAYLSHMIVVILFV